MGGHSSGLEDLKARLETMSRQAGEALTAGDRHAQEIQALRADVRSAGDSVGRLTADEERRAEEHTSLADRLEKAVDRVVEGPPPRETRVPWLGMLACAGGAAVLALWLWSARAPALVREVPIPHSNPTAAAWKGDRLWTADWLEGKIYELGLEGGAFQTLRVVSAPLRRLTGLAVSEKHLFLCDASRRVIERRLLDEDLTLVSAARSPGPDPSCLFWDGSYLWSCDRSTARLYRHMPDGDLPVLDVFPAPGDFPIGIYKDDDYVWTADAESRRLYRHRLDDKLNVLAEYTQPALDKGRAPLSGFSRRDGEAWVARDGTPALLVIPERALKQAP